MITIDSLIDKSLDFSSHIDYICKKTGKQVNALSRLCNVLDVETKVIIYNSFIKTNFDYCPMIWVFSKKGDLDKLQKVQNRALRFVYSDFVTDSSDLITKYDVKNIMQCNISKIAIEMYKCFNDLVPSYISALFKKQDYIHNTRSVNNFVLRCPRTTKYGQKCLSFMGARLWNSLPEQIKCSEDLSHFKCNLYENENVNELYTILYGNER